jgi:NAD(P) transhydrogenase subunit alpha
MRIGAPRETADGERRVALVPDVVQKLTRPAPGAPGQDGQVDRPQHEVVVESGAGAGALIPDDEYHAAGATLAEGPEQVFAADVVVKVAAPSPEEIARLRPESVLIGFLAPLTNADGIRAIADTGATSFAMEAIPRISRAQSMDALSSQANIAGYRAALIGAQELGRYYPMLMTAAGTIRPATVLVLGAGVAGLQAIATARRLGAVVQGFDVRAAVKEQVQSLGAKFLEFDLGGDLEGEGGYAKELTPEQQERQQELMAEAIGKVDVVITTALVPGRRAPILVTEEAVKLMKPGSVIVDLAGEQGGNCELSEPGQSIVRHNVKILAPLNVPSTMAEHASALYARNVEALLELMVKDGNLELDFEDEVIAGACITRGGEIVHEGAKAAAASAS